MSCLNKISATRHLGYFSVVAVASLVFLALNVLTTIKGDDIIYMFISDSSPLTPVRTLHDVAVSMHNHYLTTNGRLANLLAQLFAAFAGKSVFNVANTMVFAMFIMLVSQFVSRKLLAVYPALTAMFVMLFAPVPGETMLWLTGSCNYMWSLTMSLAWALALLHPRLASRQSPLHITLLIVASVLAGSMNESVTATVLLGMVLFFALNRQRASRTVIIMLTAYAAGVALVLASPGAWLRFANGSDMPKDISLLQMLTSRVTRLLRQSQPIVLPYAAAAYGCWRIVRHRRSKQLPTSPQACLFAAAIVVMLIFGLNAQRPYFALATFSFIAIAHAAAQTINSRPALRHATTVAAVVLCFVPMPAAISSMITARFTDEAVTRAIKSAPAQCVLPAPSAPKPSRFVMDNIYNSAHYHSYAEFYCALYGKSNVCFLPSDIYARYTSPTPLLHDAVLLPYESSDTTVAPAAYALPNVQATIVPISPQLTTTGFAGMHIANVEARCTSRWQQIKMYFYGSLSDYRNYYTYHFTHQGTTYLILPPVSPDIDRIDIFIKLHRPASAPSDTITLTRLTGK